MPLPRLGSYQFHFCVSFCFVANTDSKAGQQRCGSNDLRVRHFVRLLTGLGCVSGPGFLAPVQNLALSEVMQLSGQTLKQDYAAAFDGTH